MLYGKLVRRSVGIVVKRKYLIFLGVLAALADLHSRFPWQSNRGDSGPMSGSLVDTSVLLLEGVASLRHLPATIMITAAGFAVVIGILVWAISVIAEGSMVAGVNGIEDGQSTTLGEAWGAAWSKGWRLLGISLIAAIPLLISLAGLVIYAPVSCSCVSLPLWFALTSTRVIALRACMLDDRGIFDAYRQSFEMIRANAGEFIVLLLLRAAAAVLVLLIFILLGFITTTYCILLPLWFLIRGGMAACFSTMWTLAWRAWTYIASAPRPVEGKARSALQD